MKYLFCGLGSIGERHLGNLLSLGEDDIIAYRKINRPLRKVKKKIKTFNTLKDALGQKPSVAFITNPSAYHVPLALELVKHGCHLFIEKPLSSNTRGVLKILKASQRKKLKIFMGFMMRYHPAMIQIKKWLNKNLIGFPIFARSSWGEYLPAWHPWEDYSKGYSANNSQGGGPINTLCHDIDLVSWFFGQPKSVFALASKNSTLKIATEHSAEILLEYKNKFTAAIHLDFLQLPPKRTWEIIGDKGKIEFDYLENRLNLYLTNQKKLTYKHKVIDYTGKFNRNDMFVEELRRFIYCLNNNMRPDISLDDGINNLKILIASHRSITEKRLVNLSEVLV